MKSAPGMKNQPVSACILAIATAAVLVVVPCPLAHAQNFQVLYTFGGTPDGAAPYAGVITDRQGNIYGTTWIGGKYGFGSVYRLTPAGQETMYSFLGGTDGAYPYSAPTLVGRTLWGTASAGGGGNGCNGNGCGIVFKIDARGTETVVYRFTGASDGGRPLSGLTVGTGGVLYGTTSIGGNPICGASFGCGTVFSIDTGTGKETVLHSFAGGTDGAFPEFGSLVFDSKKGALTGTTQEGGNPSCNPPAGCGTIFRVNRNLELDYFYFDDKDFPVSPVYILPDGTIYGTTPVGGAYDKGTLYRLNKNGFTTMHDFGFGTDGATPFGGVSLDPIGNLYIPTEAGGSLGYGALVKVDTAGNETVVHDFNFSEDGGVPLATLSAYDPGCGCLLGTTLEGGSTQQGPGSGTVYQWKP
jgi:uncharacterized repeat protein (TIGR03803 family)